MLARADAFAENDTSGGSLFSLCHPEQSEQSRTRKRAPCQQLN
jgi:hypothetical protein